MTDLLNLPGIRVVEVIERDHQYTIKAEVIDRRSPDRCCLLGPASTVSNGTKPAMFRDMPIHGKFVDIHFDRQRFRCKTCHATRYEVIPGMRDDHRMTIRMHHYLCEAPFKRTFASIAADVGITEGTIRNLFNRHTTARLADYSFETPRVLGVDEKHLLGGYRCVVGNIEERTLLDLLANRRKDKLGDYLAAMKDKDRVEVVCMDMWGPYLQLAQKHFPNAVVVVDKFHVVKKANEGVEKFRRGMNADLDKRTRVKLKNQRKILLARYGNLKDKTRQKLDDWLDRYPEH